MPAHLDPIRLIQDRELVSAAVTNRPLLGMDANVRYLWDLFQSALRGETIIARSRSVATAVQEGMPVFFNASTQLFEPALGQAELVDGVFELSASSRVWGICYRKTYDDLADILLQGFGAVDLSQAAAPTVELGQLYYLSNSTAGELVTQRPPVGVAVLQTAGSEPDGRTQVYVNTRFHDLLEAHRHYRFALQTVPAGTHTPPTQGAVHTITSPNAEIEGWLPANHSNFAGKAPVGAKFGYNIAASKLAHVWPPVPVQHAYLEHNRGETFAAMGMGVPLGLDKLCVIDRHGIWWMSDCYGQVPWPTAYDSSNPSSPAPGACPNLAMALTLWFTRPVFANTASWVNSLRAAEGSGLVVRCVDDMRDATTGHLEIDFATELIADGAEQTGHLVFKSLDEGRLLRGPVVSGLTAGANIQLISTVADFDGQKVGQVQIAADLELTGREISVDIVRLDGVDEEYFRDVMMLSFPAARYSAIRSRIQIPSGIMLPTNARMALSFWFLNRASTPLPANMFSVSYRVIPAAGAVPAALPASDTTLPQIPASQVAGTGVDQYFELTTDSFPVTVGCTVLFTVSRAATDGYNGNIYLMRQRGVYQQGS